MLTIHEELQCLAKRLKSEGSPVNTPEAAEFWIKTHQWSTTAETNELFHVAGYDPYKGFPLKRK